MSKPYTYLIGWSKFNRWYYGVQYGVKANPDNIWKTYFTSSTHVQNFAKKYGDPDVIEVRKTFDNESSAKLWEHKVLRRLHVSLAEHWLNHNESLGPPITKLIGGDNPTKRDDVRKKMSESRNMAIREGRANMPDNTGREPWNKGKPWDDETKEKISNSNKGKPGLCGSKNPMWGKTPSDEIRNAASERTKKMRWYNNGETNIYQNENLPVPEGFVPGRLVKWNTHPI